MTRTQERPHGYRLHSNVTLNDAGEPVGGDLDCYVGYDVAESPSAAYSDWAEQVAVARVRDLNVGDRVYLHATASPPVIVEHPWLPLEGIRHDERADEPDQGALLVDDNGTVRAMRTNSNAAVLLPTGRWVQL